MSEQPRTPLDPEAWLREQDERIARLREQADQAKEALTSAQATVTSRDQSVTVTVNPGGVLQEVKFSTRAESLSLNQLSAKLMETYGKACSKAAAGSMQAMAGLFGDNDEAMSALRDSMPEFEDDDSGDDNGGQGGQGGAGFSFGAPERP